jgi:hypothetical protein
MQLILGLLRRLDHPIVERLSRGAIFEAFDMDPSNRNRCMVQSKVDCDRHERDKRVEEWRLWLPVISPPSRLYV